ncbi:peptidoglycan D,D-transpeptidase FtsI family protein [Neomicrococcus aestuarii]|uniref:Penicillin-binding protein n=1 Tax=Neomicrococcus aestuarii TaxID=556325 RepID=A0A1L2ZKR3_9MICC|nr:penicillin-binding protein 2 [Neomicrococcus aestuarii]APF39726.1 penicillin-binding protein [Neomicrococcus aestuarii]
MSRQPTSAARKKAAAQWTATGTRRLRMGIGIALVMLTLLTGRLFLVQGIDPEGFAQAAVNNRLRTQTIEPVRGSILDTQGRTLASSIVRFDLAADQRHVPDSFRRTNKETNQTETVTKEQAVSEIAQILNKDATEVKNIIVGEDGAKKKGYSLLVEGVSADIKNAVINVGLPGLGSTAESERHYPSGSVAGPLVGFTDTDGNGIAGIEQSQNEILTGTPGERSYEVGADGIRIPMATNEETPAQDGQSVKLTIDQDIQWAAQEAVMAKQEQFSAEWVSAIVIEVKTGKIRAIADSHSVDPQDPAATDAEYRSSASVTQAVEPGSTGKVATFATALETGVANPEDAFSVPNKYTVNNETINDSLPHATYDMTLAGIFARSYNTGTVMVGDKVPAETRYEYMKKLGIGESLDIGLPGVNKGIFLPPAAWDRRQQYTTMFGQGYSLTPLHTASVFQTIGNSGVRIEPQLIEAYVDADGTEHTVADPEQERVYSDETSAEMRRMMETVVTNGTSTQMQIDGYRVGGKSGTGQAAGENGTYDGHTSSFGGMVPIEDPQYMVLVTMYRPQGYWRDWSVGDTFKTIMSATLNHYNVAPDTTEPDPYKVFIGEQQKYPW